MAGNPLVSESAKARLCRAGTVRAVAVGTAIYRQRPRENYRLTTIIV